MCADSRTESAPVGRASEAGHPRIAACTRHPLAWMRSAIGHRRGVRDAAPIPTGADEVLQRLTELPISVWSYGFDHPSVRHLGPMAQDFAATFGLGSSDRTMSTVDVNGVCMASIQALQRRVTALETELAEYRAQRP